MIEEIRLQKYLARAGVSSRRACEELIAAGRVRVDGKVVIRPGTRVKPESVVEVDGQRVEPFPPRWIALHKPPGSSPTTERPLIGSCIRVRRHRAGTRSLWSARRRPT
ncbi:MAG: S4 domain-containing protein [Gemmatimonadales bacterium]